jgi:hypothetical protein
VATRGVDVSNRRIDDRRLGRATDLRKVGKESGKIKEPPIESLTPLAFNSIMGGTPLSGVSATRGFALGLETVRTEGARKSISGRRRGRLVRGG